MCSSDLAKEISLIHKKGRPVLVGTTSVEKSELISSLLEEEQIPHNLLNAKPENVEREAEIVAQLRHSYRDFGNEGRIDVGFRIARNTDD